MKALCIVSICLTTLLLAAYPLIFMGNLMGIAAYPASNSSSGSAPLAAWLFFWSSTLYPLPYLLAMIGSLLIFKRNIRRSLFWQGLLWGYVLCSALCFVMWMNFG